MVAEVAQVLDEWRRAERLLQLIPPHAEERPAVELQLEELRSLYRNLSDRGAGAWKRLEAVERSIGNARTLLDAVSQRYAGAASAPDNDGPTA